MLQKTALLTVILLSIPCARATAQQQVRRPESDRLARVVSDSIAPATTWRASYSADLTRRLELGNDRKSYWKEGAAVGFVVGVGVTYLLLNSGGSTASCDRSANQDAMGSGECLALYAAGGVAGAGLGALVGSAIRKGID